VFSSTARGVASEVVGPCVVKETRRQFLPNERRQQLVGDWVARFAKVTGQRVDARAFYDDILGLFTKTTFEAVTHALMTTTLTDASGQKFGDGLAIIERIDSVKGEVPGTSSDRQFRMYARLIPNAREMLGRSREFKRGVDNAVYHKGYPLNYRQQQGMPSIQVSIAMDGRQADVDVDYRSSNFPVMLFNGHLSASNSDVVICPFPSLSAALLQTGARNPPMPKPRPPLSAVPGRP